MHLLRKRVLSEILALMKEHDCRLSDDYPIRLSDEYLRLATGVGEAPTPEEFARRATRIRTRFYRDNPRIRKAQLLANLASRLRPAIGKDSALKTLRGWARRVFVSHSNVFPSLLSHFVAVIRKAGFEPVIAETTPNYGRSWGPGAKVRSLIGSCRAMVAILTPDNPATGEPRQNVIHETGIALGRSMPVIYLKARETNLPSLINPVYISFDLGRAKDVDNELVANLGSLNL